MVRLLLLFLCVPLILQAETTRSLRLYSVSASDTHRFVWFRVAKVGTRSIYQALNDNGVICDPDAWDYPFKPRPYKDYFKFAFVRNPWERVVSCYFDKVVSRCHRAFRPCFGKDFEYFVNFIARQDLKNTDIHIRLQTHLIPMKHIDFIGRMETFSEDLTYVLKTLGLPHTEVPHKHTSSHEHYSCYYTERTQAIIAKKYKKDIEAFGYTFESSCSRNLPR